MRLLYADLDREWRGGQSQAELTLLGLRDAGHHIELIAPENAPLAVRIAGAGLAVHPIPRSFLRARSALTIRRVLAAGTFDLLHLNEPHALTSAWLAGAHRNLPLLLSRRIGFPLGKNPFSRARFRSLTKFVANSRDVAQSLVDSGIPVAKIAIVNEGVAIPPLTSLAARAAARAHWRVSENDFLFGCVGVFVPEKGQRHLIEALSEVRIQHPEARLLLAGDGRCRADLQSLAARFGQSEAVLFVGFVSNVNQVYEALDAFLFPSEFEGLGTALQTAMAYELPAVSTARGALAEVVTAERTALVAEPNAHEFSVAMLRLLNDAPLRQRLGAAGRHEVEQKFSSRLMVNNTIQVYEEILRARS